MIFMVNSDICHTVNEFSYKNILTRIDENNVNVEIFTANDTVSINSTAMPNFQVQDSCSSSYFKVLHQNVRGGNRKTEELLISLSNLEPQVPYFSEYHLRSEEISTINFCQYSLCAYYCRWKLKQGGVSVFIIKDISSFEIDLNMFNKEKDFEIWALKLHLHSTCLLLLCVYRSPSGDFTCFLE